MPATNYPSSLDWSLKSFLYEKNRERWINIDYSSHRVLFERGIDGSQTTISSLSLFLSLTHSLKLSNLNHTLASLRPHPHSLLIFGHTISFFYKLFITPKTHTMSISLLSVFSFFLSLSLSFSLYLYRYLSLSISTAIFLSLSFFLSLSLYIFLSIYCSVCQSIYLFIISMSRFSL